jgi:UDP-N-acetyl-D-mannosaminuronate dehydrogenase
MPIHAVDLLESEIGSLADKKVVVLGAAYRGGVKETAFSGVFPLVEELKRRDAVAVVHDPLYSDQELVAEGLQPFHFGENADAGILQADHAEYLKLRKEDLPFVHVLIDGRNYLNKIRGIRIVKL